MLLYHCTADVGMNAMSDDSKFTVHTDRVGRVLSSRQRLGIPARSPLREVMYQTGGDQEEG